MKYIWIILIYLIMINIGAFALMGIDKKRAINKEWRISEKTLFFSAIFGGSIGAMLGMKVFRHKTKHWYFIVGMPLILLLQIVLLIVVSSVV